MANRIALLRGVNLAGKKKVGMADLREMAVAIGLSAPQTLLQSGNLVFDSSGKTDSELEAFLEEKTKENFGIQVDFHVRSVAELEATVASNPYPKEAVEDPSHLVVCFFRSPLDPVACEALRASIRGREYFEANGREAFFVYPDGIGESKLTAAQMDSKLRQRGTARNWNTTQKLLALAKARVE